MSEQQPPQPSDLSILQAAREHARRFRVPARAGRRCIDGRYAPGTEDSGRLARPGGDFGYILLGLVAHRALNLEGALEAWVRRVYEAVLGQGGGFSLHTDRLSQVAGSPRLNLDGCAHLRISIEQPSAYQLSEAVAAQALSWVLAWAERDAALRVTVLEGIHAEQAVLFVRGLANTLEASAAPFPPEGGPPPEMYFIYDEQRDQHFLKVLAGELGLTDVQAQWMLSVSRQHALATLTRVAPGIPLLAVQADLPQPEVQLVAASALALAAEQGGPEIAQS